MAGYAFSFILGIIAFNVFRFYPFTLTVICLSGGIFIFRRHTATIPRLLLLLFVAGFIHALIASEDHSDIILPDKPVVVTGTLAELPEEDEGSIRITLEDVTVNDKRFHGRVRLYAERAGIVRWIIKSGPVKGDRVGAIAVLRRLAEYDNPGIYKWNRDVQAYGRIQRLRIVKSVEGINPLISYYRNRLVAIFDKSLAPDSAVLLKAIVTGVKSGISQNLRDDFAAAGVAHLLSISGTHFGLLSFLIFQTFRNLIRLLPCNLLNRLTLYITPSQISVLLVIPLSVMYALIAGMSIPTQRALVMIIIYMIGVLTGRRDQWMNSLLIAAVIILLIDPDAIFELSFLLSFAAMISICLLLDSRKGLDEGMDHLSQKRGIIRDLRCKVGRGMLLTVTAIAGTAPIVILAFKQLSLIAPVANIIITPLICFIILPAGIILGLSAMLMNQPTLPLSPILDALAQASLKIVGWLANMRYSHVHLHNPSIILILFYYLALLMFVKYRVRLRGLLLSAVIIVYLIIPLMKQTLLRINFLDVGQGDSCVVMLPDDRIMLIDTGSNLGDPARRVIAPYLWSSGIDRIDYLVISHFHPDHYGGVRYILDNFDVGEIWIGVSHEPESADFMKELKSAAVPVRRLKRGDVLRGNHYSIIVLHPYQGFFAGHSRGRYTIENNNSLVLKILSGHKSIILCGDIEMEAERNLLHTGTWLKSDIIKVPHHGGRTSSTARFLNQVSPEIAIISVGGHNPFGHPHAETIRHYVSEGAGILRTDVSGFIGLIYKDDLIEVKTYDDYSLRNVYSIFDEFHNLRLLFGLPPG